MDPYPNYNFEKINIIGGKHDTRFKRTIRRKKI